MSDSPDPDPDPQPISFDSKQGTSYQRARDNGILVRPRGRYQFVVRLTDSDDAHDVTLARDREGFVGRCECRGYRFHDGACAHLWAMRRAERHEVIELSRVRDAIGTPPECPMCGTVVDQ